MEGGFVDGQKSPRSLLIFYFSDWQIQKYYVYRWMCLHCDPDIESICTVRSGIGNLYT